MEAAHPREVSIQTHPTKEGGWQCDPVNAFTGLPSLKTIKKKKKKRIVPGHNAVHAKLNLLNNRAMHLLLNAYHETKPSFQINIPYPSIALEEPLHVLLPGRWV